MYGRLSAKYYGLSIHIDCVRKTLRENIMIRMASMPFVYGDSSTRSSMPAWMHRIIEDYVLLQHNAIIASAWITQRGCLCSVKLVMITVYSFTQREFFVICELFTFNIQWLRVSDGLHTDTALSSQFDSHDWFVHC